MVVIIDYRVGNLKSVLNAMKREGIDVIVSSNPKIILNAKGIILPGVGTFPIAMKHLQEFDLIDVLKRCKQKGIPILGICLGMQILFELGYEVEKTRGLGFLDGFVDKMKVDAKVPHMGWNQLEINQEHPIVKYINNKDYVYFVHSFMANGNEEQLVAYCNYGGKRIPAIVVKDNIIGCQFHPEKSGEVGKKIIQAFKEMISC